MRPSGRRESLEIRDRLQPGARISAMRRDTGNDRATMRDRVHAPGPRPADAPARTARPRLLAPDDEDYPATHPGGVGAGRGPARRDPRPGGRPGGGPS
jgi:hypothetical protein